MLTAAGAGGCNAGIMGAKKKGGSKGGGEKKEPVAKVRIPARPFIQRRVRRIASPTPTQRLLAAASRRMPKNHACEGGGGSEGGAWGVHDAANTHVSLSRASVPLVVRGIQSADTGASRAVWRRPDTARRTRSRPRHVDPRGCACTSALPPPCVRRRRTGVPRVRQGREGSTAPARPTIAVSTVPSSFVASGSHLGCGGTAHGGNLHPGRR